MKSLKLTKGIQMILITLLVITLGIIILSVILNNKVSAAVAKCPNNGCKGTVTILAYGTDNHKTTCDTCKYSKISAHNKKYSYYSSKYHKVTCNTCGYYGYEEHSGSPCSKCGYNPNAHTHSYTSAYVKNGNGTHSIKYTCSCGYSYIGTGSTDSCTYTNTYTNNGTTHKVTYTCSKCNYSTGNNNDGNNGGNSGDENSENVCEHTYEIKNNETHHWEECSKCKEKKAEEAHTYGKYVDNGDGTHTATCTKCGYEKTEKHNYNENGECGDCGAKEPKQEDNSNNENTDKPNSGNNSNTDTSIVDKEIPKAGTQNNMLIAIAAFGGIAVVSMIKMKKYKNI